MVREAKTTCNSYSMCVMKVLPNLIMMDLGKWTFFISVLLSCHVSAEPPLGVDRSLFCESCLALTKEIESILTRISDESREELVGSLTDAILCENVSFRRSAHHTEDQMREACKHLLEIHGEDFGAVLLEKEQNLDIVLCYERSLACVGIKRQKNQTHHHPASVDNDIQALMEENKSNVRTAGPVRADTTAKPSKDEL